MLVYGEIMSYTNAKNRVKGRIYMSKKMKYVVGNPLLMGATVCHGGVNFAIDTSECCEKKGELCLILYKKGTFEEKYRIPLGSDCYFGEIAAVKLSVTPGEYDYGYMWGENEVPDKYAKIVNGMDIFGDMQREKISYGIYVDSSTANVSNTKKLSYVPYDEAVIYKLHVRGFTMHKSSKVKHKGTFAGLAEKLDYLEELGINVIELMPAYEFNEILDMSAYGNMSLSGGKKVNYWGYADAYYYSPKSAYAAGNDASEEFKDMVRAVHERGMEMIMDFYFVPGTKKQYICDCLRFWVLEYGVDGFMVNSDVTPVDMLKEDSLLSNVKLIAAEGFGDKREGGYRRFAICNDSFLSIARSFLKGDEGCIYDMSMKLKYNPENNGVINYIANHGTFTLMDTVSYDMRHNEENGENGKDGADYNYSWNCGAEGETKKKKVTELRYRQIKNALLFLFTAQGTPLIYSGDEMGHTCKGNNNPYCQDNEINYIDYKNITRHQEIFDFVKELIRFRKNHKVLHMETEARLMDYRSYGCPDMSFHATQAWQADTNHVYRHFAMMLNGKYAKNSDGKTDDNIYIAYNMHWEPQKFGVPLVAKKSSWDVAYITDKNADAEKLFIDGKRSICVPPRTVVVLVERV